jgi:primosomal protein N' (replication factor Y) (superfamily II helicase)
MRLARRSFFPPGARVAVLTTQPLDRLLDYRAPEGGCATGAFVEVPLGPRRVLGVVWGPGEGDFDAAKLRPVLRVLDVPPMRDELRAFLTRAAAYTLTPLPRCCGWPPARRGWATRRRCARSIAGPGRAGADDRRRARVLDVLAPMAAGWLTAGRAAREAPAWAPRSSRGWSRRGLIEEEAPRDAPYPRLDPDPAGRADRGPGAAAEALRAGVAGGRLWHDAAEGRHRVGQDRGLSGGGRRLPAPGPAGAGAAARDRADRRVPRPGRGALRRAARRMAFGRDR